MRAPRILSPDEPLRAYAGGVPGAAFAIGIALKDTMTSEELPHAVGHIGATFGDIGSSTSIVASMTS